MRVLSQRASLRSVGDDAPDRIAVDLWSIGAQWRAHLAEAAASRASVVLLSSLGLTDPSRRTEYEHVLATREDLARRALPHAVTLRLGPVFEDLAVYDAALASGQVVHHAFGATSIPWLASADIIDVAERACDAAPGAAFDLAGDDSATAEEVLTERARRRGASRATTVAVPPEILVEQLTSVLGRGHARAIVGHHQWAGRVAKSAGDGAITLRRALCRPPTSWRAGTPQRWTLQTTSTPQSTAEAPDHEGVTDHEHPHHSSADRPTAEPPRSRRGVADDPQPR